MRITKTEDGNAVMLSVAGRLDARSAPAFAAAIGEIGEACDLVLDFEQLEFISSEGLCEIIRAQKKTEETGSLTLIRVPSGIADVFRMTGLSERLNILS